MSQINTGLTRTAIEEANKDFASAFGKGNAAGVAALYTENGQVLPANVGIITGREGIQGFWQAVMDMGIKSARLETTEVEDFGGTAWEIGKYTLCGAKEQVLDSGKYLVIWKNDDGHWHLHRDIWTTSMPALK
jgi:ketosteroid isomerase-like protein